MAFPGKPLPTWTAIIYGLELLKERMILHIGNVNWITRSSALTPISHGGQSRLNRVSILLDQHGVWDKAHLRATSEPIHVEAILHIRTLPCWQPEYLTCSLVTIKKSKHWTHCPRVHSSTANNKFGSSWFTSLAGELSLIRWWSKKEAPRDPSEGLVSYIFPIGLACSTNS